jgi:hypothetical protein
MVGVGCGGMHCSAVEIKCETWCMFGVRWVRTRNYEQPRLCYCNAGFAAFPRQAAFASWVWVVKRGMLLRGAMVHRRGCDASIQAVHSDA